MKIDAKKLYLELKPYLTEEQKEKFRGPLEEVDAAITKSMDYLNSVTSVEDVDKGMKMFHELEKFIVMWRRVLFGSLLRPGTTSFNLEVDKNAFIYLPKGPQSHMIRVLFNLDHTLIRLVFHLKRKRGKFPHMHLDTLEEMGEYFSTFQMEFASMYGKEVKKEKKAANTIACPHCGEPR